MAVERLRNRPCGGRYGDIVQSIGNTPLVELPSLSPKPGVRIWAKLESRNPTGSVKDRVARALIEDAEEKGAIGPGQTILEPTSGNTGISLAMICSRKGYRLKVGDARERDARAHPAAADVRRGDRLLARAPRARTARSRWRSRWPPRTPPCYMPYQYGNPANPNAHYNGTALEILEELDEVSAFVAGLGTGGTLMGNGRRLKETFGDAVKIVAAEPMQGEPVQGLRSLDDGFIPPIIDISPARPQDLRHQPRRDRLDAQAARRGGAVRRRLKRRDREHRRAHRGRARRGQRRVRRRRRRLEVPVQRHLHAAGRRDREPRVDRLVVVRHGPRARSADMNISAELLDEVIAHALEDPVNEVCGVVAVDAGEPARAVRVFRARERPREPAEVRDRPEGTAGAVERIEEIGGLGAIYHSHVRSRPTRRRPTSTSPPTGRASSG